MGKKGRRRGWTHRQRRFVEEYYLTGNGTQAAIRAGYSPASAGESACKLLKKPRIKRAIREKRRLAEMGSLLTFDRVRQELACMALVNVVDVVTVDDLKKLPVETQRAITGIKFRKEIRKEIRDGEEVDVPYEVVEVKLAKETALRDAMKHLGMLVERTKLEGEIGVSPIRIVEVNRASKEGKNE